MTAFIDQKIKSCHCLNSGIISSQPIRKSIPNIQHSTVGTNNLPSSRSVLPVPVGLLFFRFKTSSENKKSLLEAEAPIKALTTTRRQNLSVGLYVYE